MIVETNLQRQCELQARGASCRQEVMWFCKRETCVYRSIFPVEKIFAGALLVRGKEIVTLIFVEV